jgi:hypothetical protein
MDAICDTAHETRWRVWSLVSMLRMIIYSCVIIFLHIFKQELEQRPRLKYQVNNVRNMIDGFGLIWFIVGNMWIFGEDDSTSTCHHPSKSPIYNLCLAMLIINYIQICLPCILAAILIPIFCFCMPCLIRIMARINNAHIVQVPFGEITGFSSTINSFYLLGSWGVFD